MLLDRTWYCEPHPLGQRHGGETHSVSPAGRPQPCDGRSPGRVAVPSPASAAKPLCLAGSCSLAARPETACRVPPRAPAGGRLRTAAADLQARARTAARRGRSEGGPHKRSQAEESGVPLWQDRARKQGRLRHGSCPGRGVLPAPAAGFGTQARSRREARSSRRHGERHTLNPDSVTEGGAF